MTSTGLRSMPSSSSTPETPTTLTLTRTSCGCEIVMRIGAVVLHYRSWPGIQATLERVLDQGRVPDDVILVDNCSNDGSVDRIRAAFPQLEIFELERNGGYAAGMNAGIRTLLAKGADA